ncbi:MAG: M48 family metalloprotease [Rubripirellula sp.]|nr:M48 family metalloprotease [Rubripirellula sp.]
MQLSLFLMILLSLSCGTIPQDSQIHSISWAGSILTLFGMATVIQFVGNREIKAARRDHTNGIKSDAASRLDRNLERCRLASIAAVVISLRYWGLAEAAADLPWVSQSLALQSLLLLTPGTLLMIFCLMTAERFSAHALNTPTNTFPFLIRSAPKIRFLLGTSLFPILMLLGFVDLIRNLPLHDSYAAILNIGLVVIFLILVLPRTAVRFMDTTPIDGVDKKWIKGLTQAAGLGQIDVAIWNTNKRNMNAVVVGFVPQFRKLLLSDQLIERLPRTQLAMVILHEAAHLKRRHLPLRMLSIIPIWGTAAAISPWFETTQWFAPTGSISCILLTLLTLRWVAHRTEHDADIEACRLATSLSDQFNELPDSFEQAGRELSRALLEVTSERTSSRKSSWMHPGVLARISTMRANREKAALLGIS